MSDFQFNDSFTDRLIKRYRADDLPEYTGNFPKQIANAAGRVDGNLVMLSVEDNLQLPDLGGKTNPPLVSPSLSRFEFVLMSMKSAVKANLPAEEVHLLASRCRMVQQAKIMQNMMGIKDDSQAPKAVKITFGSFKMKTPEEVLLADPNNLQELKNTAQYISKNLNNPQYARYRDGNIKQMEAINRAISLFESGNLKAAPISCIDIYNGSWKPRGKDLQNGTREIYCLSVKYLLGGPSPWLLTISEGTAPMMRDNEGHTLPRLREKVIKETKCIYMGDTWLNIVERMDSFLFAFEQSFYMERKAYAEANSFYFKRRKYPERYQNNSNQNYQAQNYQMQNYQMQNYGYQQQDYQQQGYQMQGQDVGGGYNGYSGYPLGQ